MMDSEIRSEIFGEEEMTLASIFRIDGRNFRLGLSFVGVIGLFQLMLSFLWIGPFPSFSMRGSSIGGGLGGGGGSRGDGNVAAVVFLIFIIVGVIKSMWETYKLVRAISRIVLERLEMRILEVNESRE